MKVYVCTCVCMYIMCSHMSLGEHVHMHGDQRRTLASCPTILWPHSLEIGSLAKLGTRLVATRSGNPPVPFPTTCKLQHEEEV